MKKLTLENYKSKSIHDLFFAIIEESVSTSDIDIFFNTINDMDLNNSEDFIYLKENLKIIEDTSSRISPEIFDIVIERLYKIFKENTTKRIATIMLRYNEILIDVMRGKEIKLDECNLFNIKSFSKYYSEDEYQFIEYDGKILIGLNSAEPYKRYCERFLKFNLSK